ncbi:UPF0202 protein KRE33 [Symbiodinium microadriaticum]|uniref:UPF0202 protein KRE33 n=1 Tax=Symbiodinium microadriaticum TaxID=2951 RepID=A0A1Q9CXE5_SYMMI|nr:UPF0202 protein KRE33 [Symbiodinium microadriaticum]
MKAEALKRHRLCIAVSGCGKELTACRDLVARVAGLCDASRLLLCSRHAAAGDLAPPEVDLTTWAFGQVQKSSCLGQSFHAVILFDLEEIMPETLWAAIEAVCGGGIVCFVMPEASSVSRHGFCPRLMAALHGEAGCWHVDAHLNVLRPGSLKSNPSSSIAVAEDLECSDLVPGADDMLELGALQALACTADQRYALRTALKALIDGKEHPQVVVSGRRGRGKLASQQPPCLHGHSELSGKTIMLFLRVCNAEGGFNNAALMMGISGILEGRDLRSFCIKDMWGALQERLGLSSAELQSRKSEILGLVQAEVQRIMDLENMPSKPSSKNAKSIGKKRKNVENVDWRSLLEKRERKLGKAAERMGQASAESDSRPDIEQMPESLEESYNMSTPLNVTIGDNAMQLSPKTFPSGTHGFHALQKLTVSLDGKPCSLICQALSAKGNAKMQSTIVGLIIAGVIARSSFTSVIVAAPCPDNVSELLLSCRRGLQALGIGCIALGAHGFCAHGRVDSGCEAVQVVVVRAEDAHPLAMLARQHRGLAALNVEPPNIRLLRKLSAIHSVEGTLVQMPANRPVATRAAMHCELSREGKADKGPTRDQHTRQSAGINGTEGRVSHEAMATTELAALPIRSAGAS